MDLTKIENIEFENISLKDYPDFSDAYIVYAEIDGRPLTDSELDEVNNDSCFVYELVIERLF